MNTSISTASPLAAHLHPDKNALLRIIGSPTRCAMLAELSSGEPRMVSELAQKVGCSPQSASKHLSLMVRAGMVVFTRRNYQLPRHFIMDAAKGHLEFGHCLLRLNQTTDTPPAA